MISSTISNIIRLFSYFSFQKISCIYLIFIINLAAFKIIVDILSFSIYNGLMESVFVSCIQDMIYYWVRRF